MELEFAFFTNHDLDEASVLFADSFSQPPWNENWEIDSAKERLRRFINNTKPFGLTCRAGKTNQAEMIGFVLGEVEQWNGSELYYLKEMCVAIAWQNQGVGTALYRDLQSRLSKMEIDKIYLLTQRQSKAQRFYSKLGFEESRHNLIMMK